MVAHRGISIEGRNPLPTGRSGAKVPRLFIGLTVSAVVTEFQTPSVGYACFVIGSFETIRQNREKHIPKQGYKRITETGDASRSRPNWSKDHRAGMGLQSAFAAVNCNACAKSGDGIPNPRKNAKSPNEIRRPNCRLPRSGWRSETGSSRLSPQAAGRRLLPNHS